MKAIWTAVMISISPPMACQLFAESARSTLPPVETILEGVLARVENESANDREFNQRYRCTRTRVTETRDGHGELKKREEKRSVRNPAVVPGAAQQPAEVRPSPPATTGKDRTPPRKNSTAPGKTSRKTEVFLDDELLRRFEFTIIGQEPVNGQAAWVLDFQPAKRQPTATNLKEWFIKRTAGRIWVNEADYTLARVNLHLTETINLIGGLIGNITKFSFSFDRARTADGVWFTRLASWHLEGRELLVQRAIDYREEITDVEKVR